MGSLKAALAESRTIDEETVQLALTKALCERRKAIEVFVKECGKVYPPKRSKFVGLVDDIDEANRAVVLLNEILLDEGKRRGEIPY
jgi:hypothetical protein